MTPYYELYLVLSIVVSVITSSATLATAFIILRQASLLREQNQLNALISLQREWESPRLRSHRSGWARSSNSPAAAIMEYDFKTVADYARKLAALEPVLEFLEEFAGFWKRGVLDDGLVWDSTIGWHASRYYLYSADDGSIASLRERWGDTTLYQNLEMLWDSYVNEEIKNRPGLHKALLEKEIRDTKQSFIKAESQDALGSSKSSD
jgi:hypothetical protein